MYGLLPLACRGWCSARSSGSPSRRAASPASPRNPAQQQQEQMRHSGLRRYTPRENTRFRVVMGGEGESGAYMRVVLAPGLALLGEAATSDSPRHDCGCFSSPPDRLASGLGSFGVGLFRDCANDVPLRPFLFNHALFSFFLPVFFCIFFTFFLASGLQVGRMIVGSACRGAGDDLDGDGRFFLASRLRWGPPAGRFLL